MIPKDISVISLNDFEWAALLAPELTCIDKQPLECASLAIKTLLKRIKGEEENYQKIKQMCNEIVQNDAQYDSIDITKYFQKIRVINKEGFTMHEKENFKKRRIIGAIISSLVFSIFFIFLASMILFFQLTKEEQIPWIIFAFLEFIFLLPITGIFYNLIVRIKEINGGEEDEASKY